MSTKRDADSHGIGLHTVGKLVKKYAGIMRVEAGEREFSVKLIFTIK
ncbi:GHKL domain-containing protein [Blautia wexlerae]